jgi:hypothetical protein
MRSCWLLIFLAMMHITALAQKNDTVFLNDGSRITGEFKKFDYGILTLKTSGMGTISIEYDKISTIYSGKYFEITDNTGFSVFGSFSKSSAPGMTVIEVSNGTIDKPIKDLVQVAPIKNKFWKNFYGSIDAGASYYKSSDIIQYNFSSDVNFRSKKHFVTFSLNSIYSDQRTTDSSIISKNNDISLDFNRLFKGPWWGGFVLKAQQNTELDLQYRIQGGVGAGYDIVFSNPVRLYTKVGILANQEQSIETNEISSNLEGDVGFNFLWIVYQHPEINISSGINFYPSITIGGRYRVEYELSAKYELFKDFYFGATFYDNFDSKPTNGGGALNDWGTTVSIGYSF